MTMRLLRAALHSLIISLFVLSTVASATVLPLLLGAPGWVLRGASVDMDFANSRYYGLSPSKLTTTRASTESEVCNGVLYTFAANQPAITPGCGLWVWEARTNSTPNSVMAGGTPGAPGTFTPPTGGSFLAPAGLTITLVGYPVINGMQAITMAVSGTATASGVLGLLEAAVNGTASYGQTWTLSSYLALTVNSGATPLGDLRNEFRDSVNANQGAFVSTPALTSALKQYSVSATAAVSAVDHARWQLGALVTSGQTYDFTVTVALPQQELNPNIPATVASAVKAADGTGGVISASGVYTVTGGTCTTAPTLNVTWDAGGLMTVNSVANAGSCSVLPPSPATLAYASGAATGWTGATVTLTPTDNSAKAFATGPILTSGSAATRAFSSVTAPAPAQGASYSLFCATQPQSPLSNTVNQVCLEYDNGSSAQREFIARQFSTGIAYAQLSTGQQIGSGAAAQGSVAKIATSVSGLTLTQTLNGLTPGSSAGASVPTAFSRFAIGASAPSSANNGPIPRIALWPNTALSAAQLQAVTK